MRTVKTVLITVLIAILIIVGIGAWKLYSSNTVYQNQAAATALKKAKQSYIFDHVKSVTSFNGTDAYQVIQAKRNGNKMYIWVPDHPKKAPFIERAASSGITEKQAMQKLADQRLDVKKIISVRLGAIKGNPVWEITFLNSKNSYNYVSFYFDNGKEAQRILSL
ncbi:MAG: DUF5590 domain-containing protein [Sporolactobacillus sp.]|uniref:cell wall elongation regulator TseB-like domain-containing protein n=1 Tax=Sporolactobacillus sp. STSJ-5 TaxID=2965076 RepID=UPI002106E7F1|nr:DUF5590 domain-containing protein [Sporolactobacillus sp. STSJ-5]MCQ2009163.1 DUF5590 domain-containing protein [Sporolactobacillus sp. STSJ-5]